jgi:hypothetical protein
MTGVTFLSVAIGQTLSGTDFSVLFNKVDLSPLLLRYFTTHPGVKVGLWASLQKAVLLLYRTVKYYVCKLFNGRVERDFRRLVFFSRSPSGHLIHTLK